MKAQIATSFFVSGQDENITCESSLWQEPLCEDAAVTIGDYLAAARDFLVRNQYAALVKGLEVLSGSSVKLFQIQKINFYLEKHGAFYHPVKIGVVLEDEIIYWFVLNGAASEPGLCLVQKEYLLIKKLNSQREGDVFLPKVFDFGFVEIRNCQIGFFFGQWFCGFKEFHLSTESGYQKVVIWDSNGNRRFITQDQAFPIYSEVSRILTLYYDIETFEQICPWHHAAGDFVVKQKKDQLMVRLVTARGYENITDFDSREQGGKKLILPALLMFYLNLTLRIRIDRLDGIGKYAMLDEAALPFINEGFFAGLDEKSRTHNYGNLKDQFVAFFKQFESEQIVSITKHLSAISLSSPSENILIQDMLTSHCHAVLLVFKTL